MVKINKYIEIVSSTKAITSSMGKESRAAAYTVLSKHYNKVHITLVDTIEDLEALIDLNPDVVFLGMDFVYSDGTDSSAKIWMSDYLEAHDILHTGSSSAAHKLDHDKTLAKQRMYQAMVQTAPFYVARQSLKEYSKPELPFPLFVKPTNRGGGTGIDAQSVVHNQTQLESKIESIATRYDSDALVEEYLPGREFSVAILKDLYTKTYEVMPLELIAPAETDGVRILSCKVKSSNAEQAIAITDTAIDAQVKDLAIEAFEALGARDYGRIDIRLNQAGVPHFLEANLIPSLIAGYGSFPKACMINKQLDYETMILQIVMLAQQHSQFKPSFHEVTSYAHKQLSTAV